MKRDVSLEREVREFPKAAEYLCFSPGGFNGKRSLPYPWGVFIIKKKEAQGGIVFQWLNGTGGVQGSRHLHTP